MLGRVLWIVCLICICLSLIWIFETPIWGLSALVVMTIVVGGFLFFSERRPK